MRGLVPIGRLRTPFATRADCPRNGRKLVPAPACHAEVDPEFWEGLEGLEAFSHLILLYLLDQVDSPALTVTPKSLGLPRGVFATRAPCRPNPIGLSVVLFEGFADTGVLRVRYLDCIDATPLLDIKPYLPSVDAEPEATMGWVSPT